MATDPEQWLEIATVRKDLKLSLIITEDHS